MRSSFPPDLEDNFKFGSILVCCQWFTYTLHLTTLLFVDVNVQCIPSDIFEKYIPNVSCTDFLCYEVIIHETLIGKLS